MHLGWGAAIYFNEASFWKREREGQCVYVCVLGTHCVYARHPLCIVGVMWQRVGGLCLCPQPACKHSVDWQPVTGILMAAQSPSSTSTSVSPSDSAGFFFLSFPPYFFIQKACRLRWDIEQNSIRWMSTIWLWCRSIESPPPSPNPNPKKTKLQKTRGWRSLSQCYCWPTCSSWNEVKTK